MTAAGSRASVRLFHARWFLLFLLPYRVSGGFGASFFIDPLHDEDLPRNKATNFTGARDVCRSVRALGSARAGRSGSERAELQSGERRVHCSGIQS